VRISQRCGDHFGMTVSRRRLPHIYEIGQSVFLTWRLHDSLPPNRFFPDAALNAGPAFAASGQAFAAMDRLLDETRSGAFYLRQPAVADMIVEAIHYNANILGHYLLHAFVVMPNHVHLLAAPAVALPKLTKSLKGITAKRANVMLSLTGSAFWQEESYDHLVRHKREFEGIQNYIEENPVRAGLVKEAREYRWSSAGWACGMGDQGVARGPGVRPTKYSNVCKPR
jgi:REP element-mobilizing transposase RayT